MAIALTTGDVSLIGETIHSFNVQTYLNRELIILDTHPQEMRFDAPLFSHTMHYRVPRAKFTTAEDKMKYGLFLATVREADFVAFWQPGDIYLPQHLATLVDRAPEAHERRDAGMPFRVGHMDKFIGNASFPLRDFRSAPHSVGLGGYIHEHVLGHATNFQAPGAAPEIAYNKLPWHTVFLGGPTLPGYIYRWSERREFEQLIEDRQLNSGMSAEQAYECLEDDNGTRDISARRARIAWTVDYEKLAQEKYYGSSFNLPKSTTPLWTESGGLGDGCCCGGSGCERVAGNVATRDDFAPRALSTD